MTMEETNVLRIFEQKIVRRICGCVKEESRRIRTNKEINNILQETAIVKFTKTL
jgi:hypothetical protein